jgi:hypothetical protein
MPNSGASDVYQLHERPKWQHFVLSAVQSILPAALAVRDLTIEIFMAILRAQPKSG